jgi:hypothetical protein
MNVGSGFREEGARPDEREEVGGKKTGLDCSIENMGTALTNRLDCSEQAAGSLVSSRGDWVLYLGFSVFLKELG